MRGVGLHINIPSKKAVTSDDSSEIDALFDSFEPKTTAKVEYCKATIKFVGVPSYVSNVSMLRKNDNVFLNQISSYWLYIN